MKITNDTIKSTTLAITRGVLTAWINLDYGGGGQGFGGIMLYSPSQKYDATGWFIHSVLSVIGVENWEDLEGKNIRVKAEPTKVHAIGNIIKDKWLNIDDYPREKD